MRKTLLVYFMAVLFVASAALIPSFASAQEISISPSSLSFGQVTLNTKSAALTVQVHNGNSHAITILHIYRNFPEFTVISPSLPLEIGSNDTASFKVEFEPTAATTLNGDVILNLEGRNGSTYNISIPVSGSGKAGTSTPPASQPQISATPASVSFSNVSVGTTDTQSVTIKNTGTGTLTISKAAVGNSFSMSGMSTPMSLAPGASSTITVGFTPTTASSFYTNLSLTNNSPTSPLVVPLSGTSVASVLQLSASPTSLSFGSLTTGTSSTQTVTLTNKGNASVSVSSISVSGTGFSHSSVALPVTLAAGQSTSFGIEFSPASAGSLTGIATVTSTASTSPLTIALSGTGAAASTAYSVALNWAPGTSSVVGYNIYRGTTSGGPYSKLNSGTLTTTSYTDSTVATGKTYYYVATEQNSEGEESSYSNQVTLAVP
jgi:hypothetical protein